MNRSQEFLQGIPTTTLAILSLCIFVYILQIVLGLDLQKFTLCPRLVLYIHEYYRIITSALFHANLMHIGMNMLSTIAISTMLEKRLGTLRHLFSTLWAILLSATLYLAISFCAYVLFGHDTWMNQHSVGFSGVIFHMSVLECSLSPTQSRSIFGFVSVPSYLYPWALLVILQFFMPNLSFLGHLGGILTGTLQSYGFFEYLLVDESCLREMESLLPWLVALPSFCPTPTNAYLQHEPSRLLRSTSNGLRMVVKLVRNVIETVSVCVFGRGHRANTNVSWGNPGTAPPSSAVEERGSFMGTGRLLGSGGVEDDEDWNGLPTIAPLEQPRETVSRVV